MSGQDNNIDVFARSYLEESVVTIDKEKLWKQLEKKRSYLKLQKRVSIALAASILLAAFFIIKPKQNQAPYVVDEFQKRQKLEEFEKKLSGTYEEIIFCFDCNGTKMKSKIKQVPGEPSILLIN